MDRVPEPPDGDERDILLGWLAFHRNALEAKCDGLTDEQLATRSADPSALSLLGLVRHLTEMERAYGVWGNTPGTSLEWVYGPYDGDAEPDIDCTPAQADESRTAWATERNRADAAIAAQGLDDTGGNGFTLRWNLQKLVGEYARHNGHADLLRERIDGSTGE